MFRKSYIVYPRHMKVFSNADAFVSENDFTIFFDAIVEAFNFVGNSATDKSQFDKELVNDNYFIKFTMKFNDEAQHQAWDNKYIELVDAANGTGYYPFFEEVDAHIF